MSRRKFDLVLSLVGVVFTVVLVVGGFLAFWGYTFADNKVHSELVSQEIFFPQAGSEGITSLPPADQPAIAQYAGQQLVNGEQARAFADHYIAVHLKGVADGQTYSQVSEKWIEGGMKDETLAQQRQTLFMGETLRSMLLNAYGYWKFGQMAFITAIVLWILGGVMLVLTILGFWHLSRATTEKTIFAAEVEKTPVGASA